MLLWLRSCLSRAPYMWTYLGMSEAQQGTVHLVPEGLRKFPGKDAFLEGKKEGDSEAGHNNTDLIFRRKEGFWVQLGVLLSAHDLFSSLECHGLLPMGSDLWTHVCKSPSGHEEGQLWIKTEGAEWLVFSQTPFVLVLTLIDVAIYKK